MRNRLRLILFLFTLGSFAVGGSAPERVAAADPTGTITGTVDKPDLVKSVLAVNRANDKRFPGKIDAKTGQFTIDGLPLNTAYDCMIDVAKSRLEGINLKVPRSDFEEEQPLSKTDVETIKTTARSLNKFEDQIEVMTVRGNIQHAAVLLNKLRTKPFYESKPGEVIWRLELWHFAKPDETWITSQDELFLVLYRERLQKTAFDQKSLTLDPALGGLKPTKDQIKVELGKILLPGTEPGIRLRPVKGEPYDANRTK